MENKDGEDNNSINQAGDLEDYFYFKRHEEPQYKRRSSLFNGDEDSKNAIIIEHGQTKNNNAHLKDKKNKFSIPIKRPVETKILIQPPFWSTRPEAKVFLVPPKDLSSVSSREYGGHRVITELPPKVYMLPRSQSILYVNDHLQFLNKLKARAYEYKRTRQFSLLSDLFTAAISKYPHNPDFYCNRSLAFHKLEYYRKALDDANKAIEIDSIYKRGFHRRAAAHIGLGNILNALDDYKHLMKLCPNSSKIKCKYYQCLEILNKCTFDAALEEKMSVHRLEDLVNQQKIIVKDDYDGPKMKSDKFKINFVTSLINFYKRSGMLHRKYVYKILFDVRDLLMKLPSLLYLELNSDDERLTVCGDIQGQLFDLLHILNTNGLPSAKHKYIFNGNFIGKGSNSVEVAILILLLKIVYPIRFFVARGHHECTAMTAIFGFEKEVKDKYSFRMYELFLDVFKWLPIAHIINKSIIVLHGGLFNDNGITLAQIRAVKRHCEPNDENPILRDIIWSDPQPQLGKQINHRGFGGIQFGPDVTDDFLVRNNLDYIIRSHEYKSDGYKEDHGGKCITVFSAPNYCGVYGNKATYITLNGKKLQRTPISFEACDGHEKRALYYANEIFNNLL